MKNYEISIHIPQQIENFMNIMATPQPDVGQLERIKNNILNLIPDDTFHKDIMDYENRRKTKIKQLIDKAIQSIKTLVQTKNTQELFIDIDEIRKDVAEALSTVESDYWTKIEQYMISWLNNSGNIEE